MTVAAWLVRRFLPRLLTMLRHMLPAANHVVVSGFPPIEGNSHEMVRALLQRYSGRVVWIRPPAREFISKSGIDSSKLTLVSRGSLRGLYYFASASSVFFTHGLYGEPNVTANKLTVNLWHGNGPKVTGAAFPLRTQRGLPADLTISSTRLWGEKVNEAAKLPPNRLVVSGHPRTDAFFRPRFPPISDLGIDDVAPFVVWLPSYRTTSTSATSASWSDSDEGAIDTQLGLQFRHVANALAQRGVNLVVKPHPLDSVARAVESAILIDDSMLEQTGIGLYTLLAQSAGLVSDVSSVLTDYVLLDRPIGLYFPDAKSYERGRGLFPADILNFMPGRNLLNEGQVEAFAEEVIGNGESMKDIRGRFADRVGLNHTHTAADDLLDRLSQMTNYSFAKEIRPRERI